MSRVLWLDSVAGVAGDMFAAAFVDAGLVTVAELAALPAQLGLEGVIVETRPVTQATMRATYLTVSWKNENWKHAMAHEHSDAVGYGHTHAEIHVAGETAGPGHTHYGDVDRLLAHSTLADPVKARAREIFRLLAEAEAAAHGMPVEAVVFHEVGTVDSIMDVVMAAYCIEHVGAEKICASPLKPGRGQVTMAHGTHPIPPPASARLLVGLPVAATPDAIKRPNVELSTPTGIAILKALAPEFRTDLPAGIVRAQGLGSGTMEFAGYPNVFRVMVLERDDTAAASALPYERDRVVEVACNLDDDTPERIAWLAEQVLARGALDVWQTAVTGKKGRIAVVLTLLADEATWPALADWLLRHSTTFGVRYQTWDRLKLVRTFEKRATPLGEITFKLGATTTGEKLKEKPEFEDLRRAWEARPGGAA